MLRERSAEYVLVASVVAAMTALAIFLFVQSYQQTPQIEAECQSKNSNKPQADAGAGKAGVSQAVANSATLETDIEKAKRCYEAQKRRDEASEFWSVFGHRLKITDSALVVFTFLLFLATLRLWLATDKLVAGADATAKRQLRAYVHVSEAFFRWRKKKKGWIAEYKYLNTGQTPAHDVVVSAGIVIINKEDKEPEWKFTDIYRIGIMGPNGDKFLDDQTFEIESVRTDESIIPCLKDGTKEVFLFGRIDYKDAFGNPCWTSFRYAAGGEYGHPDKHMSACREGNETESSHIPIG